MLSGNTAVTFLCQERSPSLEDRVESSLDVSQRTLLGLLIINEFMLESVGGEISHAGKNIDIPCSDEERSVCGSDEPTVHLPDQVKEDKQGPSKVKLEPGVGIQIGTADGIKRGVELGKESEYGDEHDKVRAPDAGRSPVRQLVERTTVVFPVDGQS